MAFFDDIYQQLFPKKQANRLLLQEVIRRSADFQRDYRSWVRSYKRPDLVREMANAYELKQRGILSSIQLHLLRSPYSNGIAISYHQEIDRQAFHFLFDYWAERITTLGYKKANSDLTITDRGRYVESIEKHYLKPETGDQLPLNQRYGNILIEYICVDDVPSYIRLAANVYSDRTYQPPLPFAQLADFLLGT